MVPMTSDCICLDMVELHRYLNIHANGLLFVQYSHCIRADVLWFTDSCVVAENFHLFFIRGGRRVLAGCIEMVSREKRDLLHLL